MMLAVNCTELPTIKFMEPLYVQSSLGVDSSIHSQCTKAEPLKVSIGQLFSDPHRVSPWSRWEEIRSGCRDISERLRNESVKFANQNKREQMAAGSNPGDSSVQLDLKLPRRDLKNKMSAKVKGTRWWTGLDPSYICTVSKTPICILPYPPFKLTVGAGASQTTLFVDGKYLAIALILDPNFSPSGHKMAPSELDALDTFIQQTKLGKFRPSRAFKLVAEAREATTATDQEIAIRKLREFKDAARATLKRLRIIQSARTAQAMQNLQSPDAHERA